MSLTEHALACLTKFKINTIGEITNLSFWELQHVCNFDRNIRDELIEKIRLLYDSNWLVDDIKTMDIIELGLAIRTTNYLRKAGVTIIGDILEWTYCDLQNFKHLRDDEIVKIIHRVRKMCNPGWLIREIEDTPIEKINISERALNGFKNQQINTFWDISTLSYSELQKASFLGKKNRTQIIKTIRRIYKTEWLLDEIKMISIDEMNFSEEAQDLLMQKRVYDIEDILNLSFADIYTYPGVTAEIISKLKEYDVLLDE